MNRFFIYTLYCTLCCSLIWWPYLLSAQSLQTPFERSSGQRSATYQQCISFYKALDEQFETIHMEEAGMTDAGLPLHVVLYSAEGAATSPHPFTILIMNGIHPGEPDGIDACMMLLRDLARGTIKAPGNMVIAVIPVYNIGGALNRGTHSRVNQVGPEAYGFRGNAQNLDLNRDFTKCDSKEAMAFAAIFHRLQPAIFIDNHVSDGADYQHTMTLLSTQYDKLGKTLGAYMRDSLDPAVYKSMSAKGWPMIPYVNIEDENPRKGWTAFYDPPRFSAGYAALFNTIGYTPETHMLKPFKQRVESTYDLMRILIRECAHRKNAIEAARQQNLEEQLQQTAFPLSWKADTMLATNYRFLGYEPLYKKSMVTGQQRLYYDRTQPFTAIIPIHDHYKPVHIVQAPSAYIIPQGWHKVIERLAAQDVRMLLLQHDTVITVTAYHIDDYKTLPKAYESHYKHYDITVSASKQRIRFRKGDYLVDTHQEARRFIIEMLEPAGEDSYFAWNFFDAILQQKEGYSNYRWEDIAAAFLEAHPDVRRQLAMKKRTDPAFAKDAQAQLKFVYQQSPWYEPEHLRYPVFRME